MHPLINIAIKAARQAGDVILRSIDRLDSISINEKRHNDFVTEVDQQAEKEIIAVIRKHHPNHSILAEESGQSKGENNQNDHQWIIDPLDGTTNFIHGVPHYGVSIAVKHKDKIEHGVIFDPIKQEIFFASRGQGAHLNDRRLRVSQRQDLDGALLATGLPYRAQQRLDKYMQILHGLAKQVGDARRTGSAALDLAYVAAGRFDGYWEFGLEIWDIAAGSLLVKEAGGLVSGLSGAEDHLETGDIMAAPPKIYKKMLGIIKPFIEE